MYSTPERNGFFSIPVGIIRRLAELPPPLPGQPGPFSMGATGPEAIRKHASRAFLPADEILLVTDTVIVQPDPVPAGPDTGGPR